MSLVEAKRWDENFRGKKTSSGLEVDGHIFAQIVKPLRTTIEHRKWVDIYRGRNEHVRLFLEHIEAEDLADRNWFMINQELTDNYDLSLFPRMEMIICKTELAYRVVSEWKTKHKLRYGVFFLGFTSIIPHISENRMNYNRALHLAGQSWMKGTSKVLMAWNRHPEWPPLTVLCSNFCWQTSRKVVDRLQKSRRGLSPNIRVYNEVVPFSQVQELLKTCGIQILTSEAEGWGHYIHEARASGALCVYTDFAPMNEFFQPGEGVPVSDGQPKKMRGDMPGTEGFAVSVKGVEDAMAQVAELSLSERAQMGARARESFYRDRAQFLKRAKELKKLI